MNDIHANSPGGYTRLTGSLKTYLSDMCKGFKELLEDKMEEGKKNLRRLVEKEIQKGDSLEKIADDLIEDVHVIEEIIKEINLE